MSSVSRQKMCKTVQIDGFNCTFKYIYNIFVLNPNIFVIFTAFFAFITLLVMFPLPNG